jgi:hypothetical protein
LNKESLKPKNHCSDENNGFYFCGCVIFGRQSRGARFASPHIEMFLKQDACALYKRRESSPQ